MGRLKYRRVGTASVWWCSCRWPFKERIWILFQGVQS
ncbi:hypothetical protein LINPERHAP1_LOCUS37784 [Linum perenne]